MAKVLSSILCACLVSSVVLYSEGSANAAQSWYEWAIGKPPENPAIAARHRIIDDEYGGALIDLSRMSDRIACLKGYRELKADAADTGEVLFPNPCGHIK